MNKYLLALLLLLSITSSRAQNIGGIGAQLFLDTAGGYTMPRIQSLVAGTPADSVLKATDYIYKVNDISCKDKNIQEVVELIRGEAGTHVKITVTDTKDGKRPRSYDLVRRGIPGVQAPDPLTAFNTWCDGEVAKLLANKFTIVKTFNASCAENRFFNFEALAKQYHIAVMTMEEHAAGSTITTKARAFDNDDEAGATALTNENHKSVGKMDITIIDGVVTFKKVCIGAVNVKVSGDITRCQGIYVIVYR